MSELALKLIAENKAAHARGEESAKRLDIGRCGLTELPEELFECVWLEELVVSNRWWDYEKETWIESQNKSINNSIDSIKINVKTLKQLKKLILGGYYGRWKLSDLSTVSLLNGLQYLDLGFNQISDLSPLSALSELQYLDLKFNEISDLPPLSALNELQYLNLGSNQISFLSPLSTLNELQYLDLGSNQISDLSALPPLNALKYLDLRCNGIIDLSTSSTLIELQHLNLNDNRISDLSSLSTLKALQELHLSNNQISDPSPLSTLRALQELHLRSNQISDLSTLSTLKALNTLNLSENRISDLSPLSTLIELQHLDLRSNQIRDLTPLSPFNELQHLDLRVNKIVDLSPLSTLNELRYLDLRVNKISNLSPLRTLNELKTLLLRSNQISDLSPLSLLKALQYLDLSENRISDLSPLSPVEALQSLDLSDNRISELCPLSTLNALNTLHLSANRISELSPLSTLNALKTLYLSKNRISELSPLSALNALRTLHLSYNLISNLSPLSPLKELQSLDLNDNQISDVAQLVALKNHLLANDSFTLYIYNNPFIESAGLKDKSYYNYREDILTHLAKIYGEGTKIDVILPAKVLLLGNHASGKSSLLYFIQNKKLTDNKDSTHIIRIENHFKGNHPKQIPEAIFFDFGGQDYYHGIYRVFLSLGAFQILVWNNASDRNQVRTDSGGTHTRDYNLRYWMGQKLYLEENEARISGSERSANTQDEMFLVQTRADLDPRSHKLVPEHLKECLVSQEFHLSLSADGEKAIESKVVRQKHKQARLFFTAALAEAIEKYQRTITANEWYVKFLEMILGIPEDAQGHQPVLVDQLIREYKSDAGNTFIWEKELENLHEQGMLLYYRRLIPDKVWLRPEALVSYIHREILSRDFVSSQKGVVPKELFEKFDRDIIKLLQWQKVIFLHGYNPEGDEYIIPNYLPLAADDKDFALFRFGVQTPIFILKFGNFLPFGLINQMVCFFGKMPDVKRFWRDQLLFTFQNKKVLIQLNFDALEILVHATRELKMGETRYLYYAIMALYWDEEPVEFEYFGPLSRVNVSLSKDEEISMEFRKQRALRDRIFQSAPRDLYVSHNDEDFVYLNDFHDLLSAERRPSKIVAFPKEPIRDGDTTREIAKKGGREIPIFALQPFTLKPLIAMKRVFISYAHDDIAFRLQVQKFLVNLERDKFIEIWQDGGLSAGDEWDSKILNKLENADIVILLLSQSFINSTYIFEKEMRLAMESARNGDKKIIPVLLSNCDWESWNVLDAEERANASNMLGEPKSDQIRDYQFLPQNRKQRLEPLVEWKNPENAWMQLTQAIRKIVSSQP